MISVVALSIWVIGVSGIAIEGKEGGQEYRSGEYSDHNDSKIMSNH